MNTARFIHQQVFQLRWHVLVCLALIMGVPLEEAVVNLHAGEGFHSSSLTMITLLLGPLLSALIACANVQADLDEKRDAFWRSKPVSVHTFIAGKFFIGLILALVIVMFPILFMWITTRLAGGDSLEDVRVFLIAIPLISVLTYSVCFFCNVLVRKTARAWLIGMAIACFVLLIPFVLPLNIVDVATDLIMVRWFLGSILGATMGLAVLSFMGSIVAVQRNWQIHTHLRSLLWGGAGLIFVVFLLFSRQIANIKILDEKTLAENTALQFDQRGGKLSVSSGYRVKTANQSIDLEEISPPSGAVLAQMKSEAKHYEVDRSLNVIYYPYAAGIYQQIGTDYYAFRMCVYYETEEVTTEEGKDKTIRHFRNVYLWCWRDSEWGRVLVSRLDLSDYLNTQASFRTFAIRLAKDKAVVLLEDHCLVIDIAKPEALAVIEDKPLKRSLFFGRPDAGVFPLLPVESLDMQDRIRLSLGLAGRYQYRGGDVVVNNQSDPVSYVLVSYDSIARYEVEKWNDKTVTVKRLDERPFTVLETLFGGAYSHGMDPQFIQDGKLYYCSGNKLRIFDVAGPRIRKLGNFERVSF
ncbi:MAG: hypothetical protein GY809_24440, partial [Planctomycetes bacterium]|nr:hypothetical protein [Planctomycetota bacterium]